MRSSIEIIESGGGRASEGTGRPQYNTSALLVMHVHHKEGVSGAVVTVCSKSAEIFTLCKTPDTAHYPSTVAFYSVLAWGKLATQTPNRCPVWYDPCNRISAKPEDRRGASKIHRWNRFIRWTSPVQTVRRKAAGRLAPPIVGFLGHE